MSAYDPKRTWHVYRHAMTEFLFDLNQIQKFRLQLSSTGRWLSRSRYFRSHRWLNMSDRKFVADKLLWETLERWKRSSPELDRIKFLKTVAFFNELSDRQLKTVSGTLFERRYETNELIFEEGQPGAALFLILDGRVAVEMRRENHTTTLAILERGAFFGEMALLDEAPRSANARSLEQTYTLALYRNDLSQLIQRDPQTACQIYRALAHMVGDRLRSTNQLIQTEIFTDKVSVA